MIQLFQYPVSFVLAGQFSIWNCCAWWVQTQVHGAENEAITPLHSFQDRGEAGHRWTARRTSPNLWWLYCPASCGWVQICNLRLRLFHWWECPKEQDLFHRMVIYFSINNKGYPITIPYCDTAPFFLTTYKVPGHCKS